MQRKATLLGFFGVIFTLASSTVSVRAADPKQKFTFDQHVMPVFRDKCLSCHNQDKAKGGLDLSTYSKMMEGGAGGLIVKPGAPEGSRLWRLTSHKEMPYMPPSSPMIAAEAVDSIRLWIQQGALENAGSKPVPIKPKADVSLTSIKRGKPEIVPMPTTPLRRDPLVTTTKANSVIAMAASPWAPLVAVGSQKQVLLYHGDTMELIGVLPFNHGTPQVLKFSRNGSLLLAGGGRGGQSGKVVVYDIRNGEIIVEVGNETDSVLAADISADQQLIALGGPTKMIRIYSTKDGSLVREIKKHTDWIYAIEFSPDAVLLATADRSGGLFVWESATGREFYNLRGHTAAILDLSWRDDSNVLASGSEDTTVNLWEMENGNAIKNWGAHGGGTQSVKFGHDNRLVSTGRDRVTKTWDMNGTNLKAFPPHQDVALRTAFSHDGQKVYSGDWDGHLLVFASADAKLLAQAGTNPQSAAQQLDAATKALVVKQQAFDAANAAHTAAAARAQQTAAEMAPAQKLATDSANLAQQAAAAAGPLKASADKATAALSAAQPKQQAADVKSKALGEAYAKIKAAADTAAQNNAAASGAAAKLAAEILAPRAAAAKAAADAVPPLKASLDKLTAELTAAKAEVERLKAVAVPKK
jgi:hypothetical protein